MNSTPTRQQPQVLISLALILLALVIVLALVQPADARPLPQEVIGPSEEAVLLDFVNGDERNTWAPVTGAWRFQDRLYIQEDAAARKAMTFYNKIIGDDYYWFEVELSQTAGGDQSGVLFNVLPSADDPNGIDVAYVARFVNEGQAVEWGYYRKETPEFLLQGTTPIDANVNEFVRLRVAVQANSYTVWLDDGSDNDLLLTEAPVQFLQEPSPRIGLFTNESQAVFQNARIFVGPFDNPTPTFTPTFTETPLPTSTNLPTVTPTPTHTPLPTTTPTPTPNPAVYFEPPETFNLTLDNAGLTVGTWIKVTGEGWEALDGGGFRHPSTDRADDILVQNRRVNGDYTLRTAVRFETLGTAPAGAGLTFNAISITARNGAYVVFFDGNDQLRWGYFVGDQFEQQGQATLNRDTFGLNNLTDIPIEVIVESDWYTVRVNNRDVPEATSVPFAVAAQRMEQPYIGLFAGRADVTFPANSTTLNVRTRTRPTPTFTPTVTGTPPTLTPIPTDGPTPTTGQFEPRIAGEAAYEIPVNTPGDIGVNWLPVTGDAWVIDAAAGMRHPDATSDEDIVLQSRRVNGDYSLSANVAIVDFDGSVAHGAGLAFYATNTTSRNGTYIASFDGEKLRWGHFNNDALVLKNEVNLDTTAYGITDASSVPIRVDITSDHYSIFVNNLAVTAAQSVRFEPQFPRLDQANYFGLYASRVNALFPADTVTLGVSQRVMPSPTPTSTYTPVTPTNTPVQPTSTNTPAPTFTRPTPVPTWTWTPTITPVPTSPLPTPTPTPTLFGQGTAQITTPTPDTQGAFQSPLDANAAALATSTSVAALTLTAQVTPTPTGTMVPQQDSPLQTEMPALPTSAPPTATPTEPAVAIIIVTPEPEPTQRPIVTPTPTPTVDPLMLMARIVDGAAAAAGWIWFMVGSLIFFTVAGVLAGLSFRQQAQRRYDLVEDDTTDDVLLTGMPLAGRGAMPPTQTPPEPPDDWPPSLP